MGGRVEGLNDLGGLGFEWFRGLGLRVRICRLLSCEGAASGYET